MARLNQDNDDHEFDVSDDEAMKHEEVKNRYYAQTDKECHEEWLHQNTELLTRERPPKDRSLISQNTFTKWKSRHANHKDYSSQFAPENCTLHTFKHHALHKQLDKSHHCGATNCRNWVAFMGPQCGCADCSNCVILKLKELHELCCDNDRDTVPWLKDAENYIAV